MAFLYQSACKTPGVVGIVKIVREAYPDDTQFDPKSKYYDAKSTRQNPKWYMVDIKLVCPVPSVLFKKCGLWVQHLVVCVRMVIKPCIRRHNTSAVGDGHCSIECCLDMLSSEPKEITSRSGDAGTQAGAHGVSGGAEEVQNE
jgi:hypothetical protein